MAVLSFSQLEGVWIAAGGDPDKAPLMAAIALAESSGDPTATNPTDNNGRQTSWGLWQISNGDHSEPDPNWADPVTNARLAVGKIKDQGLGAWGTYTTGAYREYLQSGVSPTTPSGAPPPSGGAAGPGGGGGSRSGASQADLVSTWGPWLGPLLGGTSDPALPGMLGTVFGPVSGAFQDFAGALNASMGAVLWLVNPRNWLRIVSGLIGAAAVITGTVLLVMAV